MNFNKVLKIIRKVIFWVLPVIILYQVYSRIDVQRLLQMLSSIDVFKALLGILLNPVFIIIAAIRWHYMLKSSVEKPLKLSYITKHYWIGMAVGYFLPASAGWDVYRLVSIGKKTKKYFTNVFILITEKFLALFSCVVLVLILYPFITKGIQTEWMSTVINFSYLIFILFVIGILLFWLLRKGDLFARMDIFITSWMQKMFQKSKKLKNFFSEERQFSFFTGLKKLSFKWIAMVLFFTFLLRALNAYKDVIMFDAIGVDLDFASSMFITPILFFVFLLPISFGSIGIREGAYIMFFGMVGIDAESAVLVSYLNLIGILLNNAIGGVIMLVHNGLRARRVSSVRVQVP
ncbi:MAG: flippase-like domain-containing protein [Bacteroidales bacterium]|nr:flippase-like domain-containing protein [Bacteroidales bacterium]